VLLVQLIAKCSLPAIYPYRDLVEVGGRMACSIDYTDAFRGAASQIAEILKGTRPGDIPFYQPTRFDLWINLKTAESLDLQIPANLLACADKVIR
jgi:putative ABC transport system substrate-binding protein